MGGGPWCTKYIRDTLIALVGNNDRWRYNRITNYAGISIPLRAKWGRGRRREGVSGSGGDTDPCYPTLRERDRESGWVDTEYESRYEF